LRVKKEKVGQHTGMKSLDMQLEYKFAKIIKAILGNQFITKDIEADEQQGTDFLIYTIKPLRVAVRLRRYDYYKYKDDFTIRWSRPSGVKTEYQKIKEGLVDYILYGFLDNDEKEIIYYFIGDLKIFRNANINPYKIVPNKPIHDSDMAVFRLQDFPVEFIIKQYGKDIRI